MKHDIAKIVNSVPPDQLIPTMEEIAKRGRRMLVVKTVLERLGLRRVWKWLVKRRKRQS